MRVSFLALSVVCLWLAYRWLVDLQPSLPVVPLGMAALALACAYAACHFSQPVADCDYCDRAQGER